MLREMQGNQCRHIQRATFYKQQKPSLQVLDHFWLVTDRWISNVGNLILILSTEVSVFRGRKKSILGELKLANLHLRKTPSKSNTSTAYISILHTLSAWWAPTMEELVEESDLWNTAPTECPMRMVHRVALGDPSHSLWRICSKRGSNSAITKWAATNSAFNIEYNTW